MTMATQTSTPAAVPESDGFESGLLQQILEQTRDHDQEPFQVEKLGTFLNQLSEGPPLKEASVTEFLDQVIHVGERVLSAQVDAIMHHPRVQKLNGSWRSLERFFEDREVSNDVEVELLPADRSDLLADLRGVGGDVKQTYLFVVLVRRNYFTPGGVPFLYGIADFELDKGADDMDLAYFLAQVGEQGHMPFLAGVSPRFFGEQDFANLERNPKTIQDMFKGKDYARYREFRDQDYARYLSLCLPRLAVREPFGPNRQALGVENYSERVDRKEDITWGGAQYALGTRIAVSMSKYDWPASILGPEHGGRAGRSGSGRRRGRESPRFWMTRRRSGFRIICVARPWWMRRHRRVFSRRKPVAGSVSSGASRGFGWRRSAEIPGS
jgi:type VI secretion system protein ImpC